MSSSKETKEDERVLVPAKFFKNVGSVAKDGHSLYQFCCMGVLWRYSLYWVGKHYYHFAPDSEATM